MDILPAIDLKDGQAVRLTKGLMNSAKIYSNEPFEIAKKFEEYGSSWLHVVDLNGAFAGTPQNLAQIEKIVNNCNLKIELGGGIRDEDSIKRYIDLGVNRIILGSIAVSNPKFVEDMAKKYPIAVGIDAVDGFVAVDGWARVSQMEATTLAKMYANAGVEAIICTDISKDGTLSGVNVEFTQSIAQASGVDTIASGGVKDIEDIKKLKEAKNVSGVIIGKAYYEGRLDLKEAIELSKK
jgi:phosphoribosylformimino-5-aminoimidazole carboxamide ribotide isomerase